MQDHAAGKNALTGVAEEMPYLIWMTKAMCKIQRGTWDRALPLAATRHRRLRREQQQ